MPRSRPPAVRWERDFGRLWFGEGVSLLGTATTAVLLPLLAITEFHAGPVWMGLLAAATWLPWLLIGLPAGAWLDRLDPRRVMITADVASMVVLGSVPLAWWLDVLSLVQLGIVALLAGTSAVFFRTAYVLLLPRIVPAAGLETANARLLATDSGAQIAGPGLAASIVQLTSAAVGILAEVVGFAVSALCLWRIRPAERRSADVPDLPDTADLPDAGRDGSMRARIVEGVRTVLTDRNLRVLMIMGGLSNFGLTGHSALLLLYLVQDLQLSPTGLGVVLMIGNVGGLLGAVIAPALGRRLGTGRASTLLLLVAGPSALLVAAATDHRQAVVSAAGLWLVGLAVVAGNVIRGAWRQRYVPPELLARVLTSMQVVNFGTMPLAGVVAGVLGSQLGVRPAMLILAGVHALACLGILFTRLGRLRDLPEWPTTPAPTLPALTPPAVTPSEKWSPTTTTRR